MENTKIFEIINGNNMFSQELDMRFWHVHNVLCYVIETNHYSDSTALKNYLNIQKIQFYKKINELASILKVFESNGVDYRIIKGIGISMTYPKPFTRGFSDFDILISKKDFEYSIKLLESIGYYKTTSTDHDVTFEKEGATKIELHFCLFTEKSNLNSSIINEMIWEMPKTIQVKDLIIKIPDKNIHFQYIFLHMIKHLKYKGIGLRFLIDIKWFVQVNRIDLVEHHKVFANLGYDKIYKAVLYICKRHLSLTVPDKLCDDLDMEVINWLMNYIIESGVFGSYIENRKSLDLYVSLLGKVSWARDNNFISFVFPTENRLNVRYDYAKKFPILIPLAWIHRVVYTIFRKDLSWKEKIFFTNSNKRTFNRNKKMFEYLGIEYGITS